MHLLNITISCSSTSGVPNILLKNCGKIKKDMEYNYKDWWKIRIKVTWIIKININQRLIENNGNIKKNKRLTSWNKE